MPSYEGVFILRKLARPETAQVLKRAATHIFDNKGILFAIENLGYRPLPFKISMHGKPYREGHYFLMRFDCPTQAVHNVMDENKRDVDIIRFSYIRTMPTKEFDCTLEEELKPPAYRESVQKMIEDGRKQYKYAYQQKTGLDYNPFRT